MKVEGNMEGEQGGDGVGNMTKLLRTSLIS